MDTRLDLTVVYGLRSCPATLINQTHSTTSGLAPCCSALHNCVSPKGYDMEMGTTLRSGKSTGDLLLHGRTQQIVVDSVRPPYLRKSRAENPMCETASGRQGNCLIERKGRHWILDIVSKVRLRWKVPNPRVTGPAVAVSDVTTNDVPRPENWWVQRRGACSDFFGYDPELNPGLPLRSPCGETPSDGHASVPGGPDVRVGGRNNDHTGPFIRLGP
ncbi:hypothetical protein Bbelb_336830 [Branchiostoma belcheri]|nr:hypothetical protein Bbelb_336830 [Branchiostoma belcheri]